MSKINKKWKILLVGLLVVLLVFFVFYAFALFHKNEEKLKTASERYFELNPSELPTGERVKTLSLLDLFHQSYLKEDLYIPYTHKSCSLNDSWVKIKKENGNYQYYTYLKCGVFSSHVDHTGPKIQLNGESTIQIEKGEEFADPGVKKVKDQSGEIPISEVKITNHVDTSTVGEYEISYTAYDALNNKTTVKRKIQVVQTLYTTVKEALNNNTNFKGDPDNNYVRFSSMLFRIYGIADHDIVLVADEDIANVNYTKIDEWLDYYYKHLNETAQKMIVEKTYCNETLAEENLNTTTCNSYTKERKVYVPSIRDINLAEQGDKNFMKTYTISWTANLNNKKEAYVVRNVFYENNYGRNYVLYPVEDNYGVRPMMTIKGDSLITGGIGTKTNPYVFGDVKKAKAGSLLNERATGEYISIDDNLYRIVEIEKDGTTRVISDTTVGSYVDDISCSASTGSEVITYDTKDSSSVAYYINNHVTAYVNTDYFVNHEIKIPVYENKIIYGEEVETTEVKAKLSAPNMYEMFAAQPQRDTQNWSYWLINSSKARRITGLIYTMGVPINEAIPQLTSAHIRVVGYVKADTVIVNGEGTYESPYLVK